MKGSTWQSHAAGLLSSSVVRTDEVWPVLQSMVSVLAVAVIHDATAGQIQDVHMDAPPPPPPPGSWWSIRPPTLSSTLACFTAPLPISPAPCTHLLPSCMSRCQRQATAAKSVWQKWRSLDLQLGRPSPAAKRVHGGAASTRPRPAH